VRGLDILQGMRDRIECMRVKPLLQPFLDGALIDDERALVARHLEACRRCGLAASTYRALKARLHALGGPHDPETVTRLESFVDGLAQSDELSPPSRD
jgi:anti-sigma factor RsiW